ncbi:hypothetical protein [Cupriavidus basilensis]
MQFHNLTVAQVTRETEDACSYTLSIPDALQQSFAYRAGQHLTFRVKRGWGNTAAELLAFQFA